MLMLENLKVLDLTNNIAGPVCAAMLGDHGAEVIHIEKPVYGDDCRNFSPMIDGVSTTHLNVNRNKKSVVLNLKDSKSIEAIKRHIEDSDVFIESSRPGVMKRLGLDYQIVKSINPRIIYCSISAYGQHGPYAERAGYDVIAQGFSGLMYYTGEEDGGPTKCGIAVGDFVGALNAFGSIVLALYHRQMSGSGQYIDIALTRSLLWMTGNFDYVYTGVRRKRTGNHDASLCPYGIFSNKKGESIVIGAVNVALWQKLCRAMGRKDLMEDSRFVTNDNRVRNAPEVIAAIENWLDGLGSVEEAAGILNRFGVPNTKVNSMDDILHDPHVMEEKWIREIPVHQSITSIKGLLAPVGIAEFSDAETVTRCAPALGEHTEEFFRHGQTADART